MSDELTNGACIPCGIEKPRRNTYFDGKFMTRRDFEAEQIYHIAKQRVLNSVLHGSGTVCGLRIIQHPSPDCRDRFAVLEPGVAIDCCGREIMVPEKTLVRVADLVADAEITADGSQDLFISICYAEKPAELVPVVLPDCDCADQRQTPNRIEECFEFKVFTAPPGGRTQPRPPIEAKLEWQHTINLADQSPRAVAIDNALRQVYVAARGDDGEGDVGARLYAYRMDNHDLITSLNAGQNSYDLAVSNTGELLYLAAEGLRPDAGGMSGIAVYRESSMRTSPDPVGVIDLGEPARLAISPVSGAVFALGLESGRLTAWSEEAITAWLSTDAGDGFPAPSGPEVSHSVELESDFSAEDGVAMRGGSMLDINLRGTHLFIIDPNADIADSVRVVIVNRLFGDLPDAVLRPPLPDIDTDETGIAIRVSRDGEYVFFLSRVDIEGETNGRLRRFRFDGELLDFQPAGRGGRWPGVPQDLDVAPTEKWAYVGETRDDGTGPRSVMSVVSIDDIASVQGDESTSAVSKVLDIGGDLRFAELDVVGRRLYVAADDRFEDRQPERGLVAVLDIEEANCGERFFQSLDGCPECEDSDGHCVVLAHLPEYSEGQPIEDAETAGPDSAIIDNRTYRELLPATNRITEVIRCMLEEGFAEGVPGPRGSAGPQGIRGPGVTEVTVDDLPAGSDPTVALVPITADPEGDQRLELGVPDGATGPAGRRGPGVVDVSVDTLPPGSDATATLTPLPGDPDNDVRLELGIPRGDDGVVVEPELTHVAALSWIHGRVSFGGPGDLQAVLKDLGLVIAFDKDVLTRGVIEDNRTIFNPIFEFLAPTQEDQCWCPLPLVIEPVLEFQTDGEKRIIDVRVPDPDDPEPETAVGFRARLGDAELPISPMYRIVLRTDFILDAENGRAVDGNHIGGLVPERPSGNGAEGGTFESWFLVEF